MEQSIEFRYDTQLLIESANEDLDEDEIRDYITENFVGDSLVAAGRFSSTAEPSEKSTTS